jgi:hypothetical protein
MLLSFIFKSRRFQAMESGGDVAVIVTEFLECFSALFSGAEGFNSMVLGSDVAVV